MDYQVEKKLECIGEYIDGSLGYEVYEIPIYAIPINKKAFCKPYTTLETKGGTKTIPLCNDAKNSKNCNKCVDTAKKLYRMNH
jgi:hypothetical protein